MTSLPSNSSPSYVSSTINPTLDTSAYASGDSLSTAVQEFASLPTIGIIEKLVIVDKDVQSAAGELWLFNATVTPAAANAAHSITDADAIKCIGVVTFGSYSASALNSVSTAKNLGLAYEITTGTSLFGVLVTRGTPTYTAAGLQITLTVASYS